MSIVDVKIHNSGNHPLVNLVIAPRPANDQSTDLKNASPFRGTVLFLTGHLCSLRRARRSTALWLSRNGDHGIQFAQRGWTPCVSKYIGNSSLTQDSLTDLHRLIQPTVQRTQIAAMRINPQRAM